MTMRRLLLSFLMFLALSVSASALAKAPPWAEGGPSQGEDLKIFLVTFGHGDDIPSWFGHTALLVRDDRLNKQRVYNYGMFSFGPDMLPKFLMGRLEFWVGEADVTRTLALYRALNRDIYMSELNLTPEKRREMAAFLAWNVKPENREYLYHHYFDNCATRIRDAIDSAVDGQLEEAASNPAQLTLREHTHRHTERNPFIDILLSTWMNDEIDQPIAEWDEMFLPSELKEQVESLTYRTPDGDEVPLVEETQLIYEASRDNVPTEPTPLWPYTGLLGLIAGLLGFWFARSYETTDRKSWRLLLGAHHFLVGLLFGIPGLVAVVFHFTDHTVTYFNENVLLWNPFTFVALIVAIPIMRGRRWAFRTMRICWYALAVTSVLAVMLEVLPAFDQANTFALAMFVPLNVLMAAAMHRFGPQATRSAVTQIGDDIWTVSSNRRFLDLEIGSRMTVVRLEDDSLWIHSPLPIDDALREELDALGEVGHIVGPNLFHHIHLGEWKAAYPAAKLYGCPGLPKKRSDLEFDAELGESVPAAWRGSLEQHLFQGTARLAEVAFYHPTSKTVILTDLAQNMGSSDHLPTRLYLKVMGIENEFGHSPIVKAAFTDHAAAQESLARLLEWDFERVSMCHGEIAESQVHQKLAAAFEWL